MIFPINSNELKRDPFDPVQRIDREIGERGRRLVIGLSVEPDFRRLTGALLVVAGNGKYLRPIRSVTCSKTLPAVTTAILRKVTSDAEPSILDIEAVQSDIAAIQASMVEGLKRQAGKYVERLMIVSLLEPRIQVQIDQSSAQRVSISNPDQVAELTGISVFDSFASRDISSGGTGTGLIALPAWMMFADRSPKQANCNRLVFIVGDEAQCLFAPASDGLDVDLPEIRLSTSNGLKRFREIMEHQADQNGAFESTMARLSVDGKFDLDLANRLTEPNGSLDWDRISKRDLARTVVVSTIDDLSQSIIRQIGSERGDEIVVDSHPDLLGTFVNQIQRCWPNAHVKSQMPGFDPSGAGCLNAILSGLLGAMSIDQMPANVPWISGASHQRILGRITPGSPSNWRQLLREMADFQPPAMRLRDAV